jgi:hypothetical protein
MIVYTSQCNMASRKRKKIGFRTEEELAVAVNKIVMTVTQIQTIFLNFQVVKRVNLKVQMRVIMRVTFKFQLQGFLKMIVNQEYHTSYAIWACNLQLKMKHV